MGVAAAALINVLIFLKVTGRDMQYPLFGPSETNTSLRMTAVDVCLL